MIDTCRPNRRVLARGPLCLVERCDCGVLHISLGGITLRLPADAVNSVRETLADAFQAIDKLHAKESAAAPQPFATLAPRHGAGGGMLS